VELKIAVLKEFIKSCIVGKKHRMIAFVLPPAENSKSFCTGVVSVDDWVEETGMNFFSNLRIKCKTVLEK
jgi:DNA/RNA endonuclease G (NUC1)